MKRSITYLSLVFALMLGALVGTALAASQEGVSYLYQGKNYIVAPDNSKILDIQAIPAMAECPCTEEHPCLYDNLPIDDYVIHGNKWPSPYRITYSLDLTKITPDIGSRGARGIIGQGLQLWANVANITLCEEADGGADSANGDIRLWFASGDHGDGYPFDGPGGVLAHGYYPPPNGGNIAGDVHFDEAETWVSPTTGGTGIDLATVAAHEVGHSLGLKHSADTNALMYPYYSSRRPYLSYDDIAGIRAIYGANTEDFVFQIEELNQVAAGKGSIKIAEGKVTVKLRKKGTTTYYTKTMPYGTIDAGGSLGDVDGVLSRPSTYGQYNGYWWHKGDLYRTQFYVSTGTIMDIDQVQVTVTCNSNALSTGGYVQLRCSLNGKVLGDIQFDPGETVQTGTWSVHLVNPIYNAVDIQSTFYNEVSH